MVWFNPKKGASIGCLYSLVMILRINKIYLAFMSFVLYSKLGRKPKF